MNDEIEVRVIELLRQFMTEMSLDAYLPRLARDARIVDLGLDSLDLVEFMMLVEDDLNVLTDHSTVSMDVSGTVADLAEVVRASPPC